MEASPHALLTLILFIQPEVSSVSIPSVLVRHLDMDLQGRPINRQQEGTAAHEQAQQLQLSS